MRAGCEQIQSVESLEKVAAVHQEVFPPVERLVSLQEFSHTLAQQLLREVSYNSSYNCLCNRLSIVRLEKELLSLGDTTRIPLA